MPKVHESELEHPLDKSSAKCRKCGSFEPSVFPKYDMCQKTFLHIKKDWEQSTKKTQVKFRNTIVNLVLLYGLVIVIVLNCLGSFAIIQDPWRDKTLIFLTLVVFIIPFYALFGLFLDKRDRVIQKMRLSYPCDGDDLETVERITAELES